MELSRPNVTHQLQHWGYTARGQRSYMQGHKPGGKFGETMTHCFRVLLLTRKNGRVEISDTIEDKNKICLDNYWPAETKSYKRHIWGDMTYYRPPVPFFFLGGGMSHPPLSPAGFTPLPTCELQPKKT